MNMNIDTGTQHWKYLKKDTIDITVDFADVRGIDEQNIIRLKTREHGQIDVLQALGNDDNALLVIISDQRQQQLRVGFDERRRNRIVEESLIGIEGGTR